MDHSLSIYVLILCISSITVISHGFNTTGIECGKNFYCERKAKCCHSVYCCWEGYSCCQHFGKLYCCLGKRVMRGVKPRAVLNAPASSSLPIFSSLRLPKPKQIVNT
uniref:Cysteine rich secreted protein n=1 Tax=Riptortus pedestris TaxID=329032 RepID=R4WRG5_RIPPE|nr:cysteine rich secreted protein [Riptortus pedestris]